MAFRFNGGMGAVTCDHCNVIIDEDLSYAEYMECYGNRQKKDYCGAHFRPESRKKQQKKEEPDGDGLGSASCEAGRIETTPQRR